jgi:uncharacterized membrane protein YphA (DoxX/SURF4 family)
MIAHSCVTKRIFNRAFAVYVISFAFIFLWIYAASSKIIEYDEFVSQIGQSPLVTDYREALAWAVPAIEICIALMLMTDTFRVAGLHASFSLMLLFTGYVAIIMTAYEDIPCSCGGILSQMGWKQHLIFNIGATLLALVGVLLAARGSHEIKNKEVIAISGGSRKPVTE